ncbi:hypothetical protein [Gulosibacter molinativorax]|nr:hypothetical protein [Gulosibacter molinativorax]QUY62361.1 Hypotetical protein [Gulosibacter molinativorax]
MTNEQETTATEPVTLVNAGDVLGSIFGTLDPSTVASCSADGTCN